MALAIGATSASAAGDEISAAGTALRAPFNVLIQRDTHGLLNLERNCEMPPAPIVDLQFDGSEASKETRKLLFRYQRKLNEISDAYVGSKPANRMLAQCAQNWLELWARNGALLGQADADGKFVRKKVVASMALAKLKLEPGPAAKSEEPDMVRDWLNKLGHIIREEYSSNLESTSRRNFHLYEAAMSVTAAGIATGDKALFDWGIERTRFALSLIPEDGWFPWAPNRGKSALVLQLRSIGPLIIVAEIADANGVDLYDAEDGAIHRLVSTAMEGYYNPSLFAERTGVRQVGLIDLDPQITAWMAIYTARFPDALPTPQLRTAAAPRSELLGGDLELLYTDKEKRRAMVNPLDVTVPAPETSQK